MLSKRSIFKYAILYNIVAILVNLVCDIILPDKYETTLVKPIVSGNFWTDEIGTRLIKSAAKTRPSVIIHSEDRSTFILEGTYGTRNIAFPWIIHYAADYLSGKIPYFESFHSDVKLLTLGYLVNILATGIGNVAFSLLTRRVLKLYNIADMATIMFMSLTPLWTLDPLSPFPIISALSLIGLFLFEGGSAQFAGGFIISISSMVPGGFYLASFAMMGFLRRVLSYLSSTWNDFWYQKRNWCNRICVVIPKAFIWFYFFLFQTAAALFSYFMFAFVFFLFNRIARMDNLVGTSSKLFKDRSGQAAKLAEYAKPVLQLFSIKEIGESDNIINRISIFARLFNGCMYTITIPIVAIALVSIASFFKGFFRKKHKLAFVHNRRYNLLRRILPHYIYLSIMLIFAHFHGQLTDLLLLLITCPVIFWNFVFLIQKRINMNQMDQFGLVTNWIKIFSKQNFNISVVFIIVISIRPMCNALTHIIAR